MLRQRKSIFDTPVELGEDHDTELMAAWVVMIFLTFIFWYFYK